MLDFPKNGVVTVPNGTRTIRFGEFEADLQLGEVRKSGSRVKLQEQPFKVLQLLVERPGELVTREELRSRIWPEESFGDFDHAVNVAVGKLRTALGDSADNPTFVETVPRRGYRFVAKLEGETPAKPVAGSVEPPAGDRPGGGRVIPAAAAVMCARRARPSPGTSSHRSRSSRRRPPRASRDRPRASHPRDRTILYRLRASRSRAPGRP